MHLLIAFLGPVLWATMLGELITEFSMVIDLHVTVEELLNVIHPHPTFSKSSQLALESHLGIATDILAL